MILSIIDKLNEWVKPFEDFFIEHGSNPLLWLGMFLAGVFIFLIVYGALHKNGI